MLNPRVKLTLAALSLFSVVVVIGSTRFLSRMDAAAKGQGEEERTLENLIPKHVPIGIKIRKEKEKQFKDLRNDKWTQDLEVEITNTGDRPIYFLYLDLELRDPELKAATGSSISFPLIYGRDELGDVLTKAAPDDVPIRPGEIQILRIHPSNASGWENGQRKAGWPQPKKIHLIFQELSFGDGTGLVGTTAVPLPRTSPKEISSACSPLRPKEKEREPFQWILDSETSG